MPIANVRKVGEAKIYTAHSRSPFRRHKLSDDFDRRASKRRRAAAPYLFVALPVLILPVLADGMAAVALVFGSSAALVLFIYWYVGITKLRITPGTFEIRHLVRTQRIDRADIDLVAFDSYRQKTRYGFEDIQVLIILGNDQSLGYLSRPRWGLEVLEAVAETLDVPVERHRHTFGAAELEELYPGLFPFWTRRPQAFGGLITLPLIIGMTAILMLIEEYL